MDTRLLEEIKLYIKENYVEFVPGGVRFSQVPSFEALNIDKVVKRKKEKTFSDTLIELVCNSGKTESEIYKPVGIDRRLFSKIISDRDYTPSFDTCILLAISLKLSIDEVKDFLSKAGRAFSHGRRRDLIVEYFFINENYDLFKLNEVLLELGEDTLSKE